MEQIIYKRNHATYHLSIDVHFEMIVNMLELLDIQYHAEPGSNLVVYGRDSQLDIAHTVICRIDNGAVRTGYGF